MPTNEPLQNFQIPSLGDAPNVPKWLADLVRDLIGISIPRYVSEAARDLAIPTPQDGQRCITGAQPNTREWMGQGGQWTETFPLYGAWDAIPSAPLWEPFGVNSKENTWWVRQEGEWGASNNILLRRTLGNNLAMVAGTSYPISGMPFPPSLLPAAGIYGPYVPAVISAGTARILGLIYWDAANGQFRIISSQAVTLTGGNQAYYVSVPAMRWLIKVPALP